MQNEQAQPTATEATTTTNDMNTPTPTPDSLPTFVPDAPEIDTSWMDNATTEEPVLKGPTTFQGTLVKFGPRTKQDTGAVFGWTMDVAADVEVPHNLGGSFPVGKTFPFLSVFTTPSEGSTPDQVKSTNGRVLKLVAALFGVPTARQESAAAIKAKLLALGVPLVPSPTDANQAHYDQHVGKKFNFTLKPDKVSDKGYMQYKLVAVAPVVGTEQQPY